MAFAYRSSSIGNLLCTATGWSPQTTQLQVGFVSTVTAWAVGFAFSFQNKLRIFFFTINSAYTMIWHNCYWPMVSLFLTVLVLNFLHHCCSPPPSQLTQLVLMCLFELLWDVGKEKTKDKMIGAALLTLLFVPCFRSEMSWLTLLFFLLLHLLSLLS